MTRKLHLTLLTITLSLIGTTALASPAQSPCDNAQAMSAWFEKTMADVYALTPVSLSRAAYHFSVPAWQTVTDSIQRHRIIAILANNSLKVIAKPTDKISIKDLKGTQPAWQVEQSFGLTYVNRMNHQWHSGHQVDATVYCDAGSPKNPFVIATIHDTLTGETDYNKPNKCPPIEIKEMLEWQIGR